VAPRVPRAAASGVTAPRLTPVRLENLTDVAEPDFQRGGRYDGARYSRVAADGLDLGGADFIDCEFQGATFNEAQLRGSTFRDCILEELYAPVFLAARSTWRVLLNSMRADGSRSASTAASSTS
jgi:hypothetical protein